MAPPAATVAVLGDDLMREVFILLPTSTDLLRAALACKPFLRAARSAAFLRRFRRRHPFTCPLLLGCLLHGPTDRRRATAPHLLPAHPDAATRRLIDAADFAFSFLPRRGWPQAAGTPWQLLDCRNGRALLLSRASRALAVADPLTRRWVPLPAIRGLGYALVADDGDSSLFKAVCISRRVGAPGLRAFLLSSADLRWVQVAVAGLDVQPDLAGSRAMQANRSLYWKLVGGERVVAFNTDTMEFAVLDLPPFLKEISFDIIEKGEDGAGGLYLLTMRGFCIEVWVGVKDGADGGLAWTLVEKSVMFHRAMAEMLGSEFLYQNRLDVIGVVAGVVFLRNGECLFSIDLQTMKMTRVSPKENCPSHLIYPCTIAWPPSFLNPTEQGA
ncbi:uncharacterized protein [Lolium perenne]|uniref:uncharacterized protein n=1 Tax=Lolium perenne TaxID=4522 RepID=UPI0021EAD3A7|nr:uncharacterized protein LOC127347840 [Lolium perenne]